LKDLALVAYLAGFSDEEFKDKLYAETPAGEIPDIIFVTGVCQYVIEIIVMCTVTATPFILEILTCIL